MGGEAELVPGNNTAIYGAIDRSKGEIEVHPDIWLPNQEAYTKDLVPKGTLKLSKNPYEGNQGYCVSQQFAKKMNITAIEDLGRPEVVKAMDSDGNGKGEFWIGADGWASANDETVTKIEINPATSVVLIIFIITPLVILRLIKLN